MSLEKIIIFLGIFISSDTNQTLLTSTLSLIRRKKVILYWKNKQKESSFIKIINIFFQNKNGVKLDEKNSYSFDYIIFVVYIGNIFYAITL